jgi:hypothetical protein
MSLDVATGYAGATTKPARGHPREAPLSIGLGQIGDKESAEQKMRCDSGRDGSDRPTMLVMQGAQEHEGPKNSMPQPKTASTKAASTAAPKISSIRGCCERGIPGCKEDDSLRDLKGYPRAADLSGTCRRASFSHSPGFISLQMQIRDPQERRRVGSRLRLAMQ